MSRLRRAVQLLDSENEVVDARAVRAVLPLIVVADAVDFVVESDGAANRHVGLKKKNSLDSLSWHLFDHSRDL